MKILLSPLLSLISKLIILIVLLTLIIQKYYVFSKYEYVWISSKILTVKKIIENKKNGQIFYDFFNSSELLFLKYNYESLLRHSHKDKCEENYKQCGILDTYGNKLCFNESLPCPVNHILIDLKSKEREYQNKGYFSINFGNESSNVLLYYTNIKTDNPIIVDIIYSYSQPKYITYNNLILDKEAIKKSFNDKFKIEFIDDGDDPSLSDLFNQIVEESIKIGVNYYNSNKQNKELNKLVTYIDNKINKDKNNQDKYCVRIYDNYYVKNYIGFENNEKMEEFLKTDFSPYNTIFPNIKSVGFAISSLFFWLIIIIKDLCIVLSNEVNLNQNICWIVIEIILYSLIFFGFFIYFLVVYVKVYKNKVFSDIKSIQSDDFITNFIKEFRSPIKKKGFILSYIILFCISALLFIMNFIIKCLIEWEKKNKEQKTINTEENKLNNKMQNE